MKSAKKAKLGGAKKPKPDCSKCKDWYYEAKRGKCRGRLCARMGAW